MPLLRLAAVLGLGLVSHGAYPQFRALLGISGLVLSLMFTLAEERRSPACLLYFYQRQLYSRFDPLKPDGRGFWVFFASATMAAPLVLSYLQIPLTPGVK